MAEHYFKKVFKGYDPEQVDSFLVELSDRYTQKERALSEELNAAGQEIERLKSRVAELQDEALIAAGEHEKELDEKGREYEQLCARVGESMLNADKIASDIVDRAEKDAEHEAYAIRERAEREAKKLIDETERRCAELIKAAEEFRKRQEEMARSVSDTERSFGDALNKLREGLDFGKGEKNE